MLLPVLNFVFKKLSRVAIRFKINRVIPWCWTDVATIFTIFNECLIHAFIRHRWERSLIKLRRTATIKPLSLLVTIFEPKKLLKSERNM